MVGRGATVCCCVPSALCSFPSTMGPPPPQQTRHAHTLPCPPDRVCKLFFTHTLIFLSRQVKSYLAGNPPIKIKLNDDLLITRRDGSSGGPGFMGGAGGFGGGGGFSSGDYAADSLVILEDANFHEVGSRCKSWGSMWVGGWAGAVCCDLPVVCHHVNAWVGFACTSHALCLPIYLLQARLTPQTSISHTLKHHCSPFIPSHILTLPTSHAGGQP